MRVLIAVVALCGAAATSVHGYNHGGSDWVGTCRFGDYQSPVALDSSTAAVYDDDEGGYSKLELDLEENSVQATAVDDTLRYMADWGEMTLVPEDGSDEDFDIYRFDVRAPGEHTIDGLTCALELQLFAQKQDDSSKLRALGICFEAGGDDDNEFIDDVIAGISEPQDIDLEDAFDDTETIGEWFEYKGSLTYPPCTEGIDWGLWTEI